MKANQYANSGENSVHSSSPLMRTDIAILIQARLGSSRLPEKILASFRDARRDGYGPNRITMLESVFRRCLSTSLQTYIITTPIDKQRLSARVGMFRANVVPHILSAPLPEADVLGRYCEIAEHLELKHIIRVTADCPLIDPSLILELLSDYWIYRPLIAGLRIDDSDSPGAPCYQDGLDVEIVSIDLLRFLDHVIRPPLSCGPNYDREHVTSWAWRSQDLLATPAVFRKSSDRGDFSTYKWSVDTEAELEHVRILIDRAGGDARWEDYLRVEQELREGSG